MMEKRKVNFPKVFFTKKRTEIDLKDALQDVTPVEWVPKVSKPTKKKKPSNNTNMIANIK